MFFWDYLKSRSIQWRSKRNSTAKVKLLTVYGKEMSVVDNKNNKSRQNLFRNSERKKPLKTGYFLQLKKNHFSEHFFKTNNEYVSNF